MRAKYISYGKKREPEEISDVLGAVIEKAAVTIDVRQGDLVERWDQIVPKDWSDHGTPVGVRDGTLLVEVQDGTTASLLKYQVPALIATVGSEFGSDLITAVKVRIAR